ILDKPPYRLRQRLDITNRYDEPVALVLDHFRDGANRCGYNRDSPGEGLKYGHGQSFREGGQHEHVGSSELVSRRLRIQPARKNGSICDPEPVCKTATRIDSAVSTNHGGPIASIRQGRKRLDELSRSLVWADFSEKRDTHAPVTGRFAIGWARQCRVG